MATPSPQLFCRVPLHLPGAVSTAFEWRIEDGGGGLVPQPTWGRRRTHPQPAGGRPGARIPERSISMK